MRIRRIARKLLRAVRPQRPHPAILMYHRVIALPRDPWDLAIDPVLFDAQMAYLRAKRSPMAMDELVERLERRTLPSDAIAVTFDDGYLDNLVNAKPTLVKHSVPATVFVSTGFTGSNAPFWWDELAGMILESAGSADLKALARGTAVTLAWEQREPGDSDAMWRGWETPRTARQRSYLSIWSKLQSASDRERANTLDELRRELKAPADPLGLPMNSVQLEELVAGQLVSIGGHTVTHRALTDLDRSTCRSEISEGRHQCHALTGLPVEGFAYPYGNFDSEVSRDVAESGYSWACTTENRYLDDEPPNKFELPRIAVSNQTMNAFIRSIST